MDRLSVCPPVWGCKGAAGDSDPVGGPHCRYVSGQYPVTSHKSGLDHFSFDLDMFRILLNEKGTLKII